MTAPSGSTTMLSQLLTRAGLNSPWLRNEFGSNATPVPRKPNVSLVPEGVANCFSKKSVSSWPSKEAAVVSICLYLENSPAVLDCIGKASDQMVSNLYRHGCDCFS